MEQIKPETHNKGWIEVICGSMFSGKTEELIRRLKRAIIGRHCAASPCQPCTKRIGSRAGSAGARADATAASGSAATATLAILRFHQGAIITSSSSNHSRDSESLVPDSEKTVFTQRRGDTERTAESVRDSVSPCETPVTPKRSPATGG